LSTGNPYLSLRSADEKEMLKFNTEDFIISSPGWTSTSGLQFNIKSGIIKLPNSNYISGLIDNNYNTYLLKIGNLKVHKDGTIYIGENTLEEYINTLIEEAK
jgi:hypothetical protein